MIGYLLLLLFLLLLLVLLLVDNLQALFVAYIKERVNFEVFGRVRYFLLVDKYC